MSRDLYNYSGGEARSRNKRKITTLERELKRKEKALAEMAALLVLRKMYGALWEEPGDD